MNKREHFECLMKQLRPNMPLDYNEEEGYYYHDMVSLAYQAYTASPKKRPTEPGKITKEQLAAMKADTSDIVDHLRGIYAGAASRYPVTPLMMKAADEIERLRVIIGREPCYLSNPQEFKLKITPIQDNKKPPEGGLV